MCDVHSPFYRRAEHVAALVHHCDECTRPIMRGERYHVTVAVFDGDLRTTRAHPLCEMLAQRLVDDEGCHLIGNLRYWEGPLSTFHARWFSSLLGSEVPARD
jgi:hypothetical protein